MISLKKKRLWNVWMADSHYTRYCSPSSLFEEKGETRRDAEDFNEHTQIDWSLRARPCKVKYGRSQKAVSSSNHLSEPFALNFRFFFKHQKHGLFQQNGPFVAQQKKHLQKHRRCLRLEIDTKWVFFKPSVLIFKHFLRKNTKLR